MSSNRGFISVKHFACMLCIAMAWSSFAAAQTPPTHANLLYAVPGPRHELDLYLPVDPCGRVPVVIYLYGGAWLAGDKADVAPYVDDLLSRGFAIAAVNYRYSYQALYPAQTHDVKSAIRWLRAKADIYNLDRDRIGIFGFSAGAHLAALAGTTGDVADLEGTVGGNLDQSSRVHIVGNMAAPTDLIAYTSQPPHNNSAPRLFGYNNWWEMNFNDPELIAWMQTADPAMYASNDDPPHFHYHGQNDVSVPLAQAEYLHAALLAADVPSTLIVLPREGHALPYSAYAAFFDELEAAFHQEPLLGDFNCDGIIGISDLLVIIGAWGECVKGQACPDINNDGEVNVTDLLYVIANWTFEPPK